MLTPAETCSHRIAPAKRRILATKLANSGCRTTRRHAHRQAGSGTMPAASIASPLRFRAGPALARFGHYRLELAHREQRFGHPEIDRRLQDHLLHLIEG